MSEKTNIAWCDATWGPVKGCEKVSEGCAHCYITATPPLRIAGYKHGDPPIIGSETVWNAPFRWNKKSWVCECGLATTDPQEGCQDGCLLPFHRRRVFVLSCSDWLWDQIPIPHLARMLDTIRQCSELTFILCTKRPELWRERIMAVYEDCDNCEDPELFDWLEWWLDGNPIHNVWILASAENQKRADERIPHLLKIPAVVHGLSCEPLLGPIDLEMALEDFQPLNPDLSRKPAPVQWVIVGGESGKEARPCNVEWIRSIKDQCQSAGVPCFVKQLGSKPVVTMQYRGQPMPDDFRAFSHPKGGDPEEWPADLRVQQFPRIQAAKLEYCRGALAPDAIPVKPGHF